MKLTSPINLNGRGLRKGEIKASKRGDVKERHSFESSLPHRWTGSTDSRAGRKGRNKTTVTGTNRIFPRGTENGNIVTSCGGKSSRKKGPGIRRRSTKILMQRGTQSLKENEGGTDRAVGKRGGVRLSGSTREKRGRKIRGNKTCQHASPGRRPKGR